MNVRQDARQHQRSFKKRRFKLKGEVFFVKVSHEGDGSYFMAS